MADWRMTAPRWAGAEEYEVLRDTFGVALAAALLVDEAGGRIARAPDLARHAASFIEDFQATLAAERTAIEAGSTASRVHEELFDRALEVLDEAGLRKDEKVTRRLLMVSRDGFKVGVVLARILGPRANEPGMRTRLDEIARLARAHFAAERAGRGDLGRDARTQIYFSARGAWLITELDAEVGLEPRSIPRYGERGSFALPATTFLDVVDQVHTLARLTDSLATPPPKAPAELVAELTAGARFLSEILERAAQTERDTRAQRAAHDALFELSVALVDVEERLAIAGIDWTADRRVAASDVLAELGGRSDPAARSASARLSALLAVANQADVEELPEWQRMDDGDDTGWEEDPVEEEEQPEDAAEDDDDDDAESDGAVDERSDGLPTVDERRRAFDLAVRLYELERYHDDDE
jgi:hypothetical protein